MLYKVWSIRPKWLSLDVKTFKNWDEILLTISQSRPVWTLGFTFGIEQIQPLGQAGRPPSLGQDREGIQQTSEEQSQQCRQQARPHGGESANREACRKTERWENHPSHSGEPLHAVPAWAWEVLYVVKQKCTTAIIVIYSDISLFYYQKFFCWLNFALLFLLSFWFSPLALDIRL